MKHLNITPSDQAGMNRLLLLLISSLGVPAGIMLYILAREELPAGKDYLIAAKTVVALLAAYFMARTSGAYIIATALAIASVAAAAVEARITKLELDIAKIAIARERAIYIIEVVAFAVLGLGLSSTEGADNVLVNVSAVLLYSMPAASLLAYETDRNHKSAKKLLKPLVCCVAFLVTAFIVIKTLTNPLP